MLRVTTPDTSVCRGDGSNNVLCGVFNVKHLVERYNTCVALSNLQ